MTITEKERLAVVENKIDTLTDEIKEIKGMVAALDTKFAAKWVQTIVGGLVAAILLAFAGVFIHFFISDSPQTADTPTSTQAASSTGSTPAASASAQSQSTAEKPTDSQTSESNGGVSVTVPKSPQVTVP